VGVRAPRSSNPDDAVGTLTVVVGVVMREADQ
jgi:hypothetical protein